MKIRPGTVVLGAVGLVGGVLGVGALREATLSTHQPVAAGSQIELVLSAKVRGAESGQSLAELVESKILTCRLEVTSDVIGDIEPVDDDGRFRAVLSPTMDETNRRQFRGCLEDWLVDHIQIDVLSLEPLG